jgi:hypothetical protein
MKSSLGCGRAKISSENLFFVFPSQKWVSKPHSSECFAVRKNDFAWFYSIKLILTKIKLRAKWFTSEYIFVKMNCMKNLNVKMKFKIRS